MKKGGIMIGSAVQYGRTVIIYDEQGWIIGSCPAEDGLVAFTPTTVCVKRGAGVAVYDGNGQLLTPQTV